MAISRSWLISVPLPAIEKQYAVGFGNPFLDFDQSVFFAACDHQAALRLRPSREINERLVAISLDSCRRQHQGLMLCGLDGHIRRHIRLQQLRVPRSEEHTSEL